MWSTVSGDERHIWLVGGWGGRSVGGGEGVCCGRLDLPVAMGQIPENRREKRDDTLLCRPRSESNRCLLTHTVTLFELVDTTARIYELLSACEERVTLRADFNTNVALRRTCFNNITASTSDGGLLVVRMNVLLHGTSPLSFLHR